MSLQELNLANLTRLDCGKVVEAYQDHILRVARDLLDRPGEGTARKVILELQLIPVLNQAGDCEEVKGQFFVKSTVPTHHTRVYSLGIRPASRGGMLIFNEDAPEAINQSTMFAGDDEERE